MTTEKTKKVTKKTVKKATKKVAKKIVQAPVVQSQPQTPQIYNLQIPMSALKIIVDNAIAEYRRDTKIPVELVNIDILMQGAEFCMRQAIDSSNICPLDIFLNQMISRAIEMGSKGIKINKGI